MAEIAMDVSAGLRVPEPTGSESVHASGVAASHSPCTLASTLVPPINVGVFVASLRPPSAAEQRFQGAIFEALLRQSRSRHKFYVLTYEPPDDGSTINGLQYVKIEVRRGRLARTIGLWKLRIGRLAMSLVNLAGGSGSEVQERLDLWMHPELPHFQQIRDLNLRIIWNLSQRVLSCPVPFIRIVWDVNHRIHSMYPEFSYTRCRFDGCESDLPSSLARASYILVGTEEGKRQLVGMYGVHADKVRVVPFPTPDLPSPDTAGQEPHTKEDPYVFYPARFWPHKNHVVIIGALRVLREEYGLRLRCVFSGVDEGNLAHVLRYAERLGVRDQVDYVGSVSESRLAALYRDATALVYASAVGPDNLPPLEAMAHGCPVITAEVPGAHEQYGDAALFFAPTDDTQLAKTLKDLIDNPVLRQDLIVRGYRRAVTWSPEDYVGSVLGIIDEFAPIARSWERCDSQFT